jgi:hypothetical protein
LSLDLSTIQHHPAITEIVDVLCAKTEQRDRNFFQVEVAYFLGKIASTMRATVVTKDKGDFPVNIYSVALASSGFGKGHSVGIFETQFINGFKHRFVNETLPVLADQNLWVIANNRAARKATDQQEEFDRALSEYNAQGEYLFTFDSGSTPAVKQMHIKLQMANAGSINLQIDEIGSNLLGQTEALTSFLELYDTGRINQKLKMNSAVQTRPADLDSSAPANMLLFGTPAKLFDGANTESEFLSMLETGYGRRCLFGWGIKSTTDDGLSAKERYLQRINPANNASITKWSQIFYKLADPALFGWRMEVDEDVGIALIEYNDECKKLALAMSDHQEIQKAEMEHRHSKAIKLAGAFAFIDNSTMIEMGHLHSAIKLVEESGEALNQMLSREKNYWKLAKYVSQTENELTHADLHEALPFYKTSQNARNEMMSLATAWGYKNHIIIKKSFIDGIELFKGETLKETDLDKMVVSYSDHWAYNYLSEEVPFHELHRLTQADGMHWANHHFVNGHRAEEDVTPGFTMIALDIDGGITLQTAHELMSDYKFLTYTTKRHTEDANRFRMLLPINYRLQLDNDEYKEFMHSVFAWLPFKTDESYDKREKKSESFAGGSYFYNLDPEAVVLDVLDFIPKTSRYEQRKKQTQELGSLDNLERWFAGRIGGEGSGRNNHMIKYALTLVDAGWDLPTVQTQVHAFNKKLSSPMSKGEIDSTILVTVAKKYQSPSP